MNNRGTRLLTFSGIDGAGKTTQINWVCTQLAERGYTVRQIAFWDDVAVMPRCRAGASFRFLNKAHQENQATQLRNDKNVQRWYLTLIRAVFYLLDSLSLRLVVSKERAKCPDYIICDRYIYDQLVQIRAQHWFARAYMRLLIAIAPSPTFAFLLDASPEAAFQRKPEYPVSFMRTYRQAFLRVRSMVPQMIVLEPGPIDSVSSNLLKYIIMSSTVLAGEAVRSSVAVSSQ